MSEDKSKYDFLCSFCGKARKEVKHLISGPKVFICDECVVLCVEIIRESEAQDGRQHATKILDALHGGGDAAPTSR